MKASLHSVSDLPDDATLSIGDLARRTGVTAATLRVWETRYGFPVPRRRDSGHRRYVEADVARILDVVSRREAGTRLDVAIEHATSLSASAASGRLGVEHSVFAQLRRNFPELMPHRLHKSTLMRMSWAIEDELVARGERAHVFGAFQRHQFYASARHRWEQIAAGASSAYVFADFDDDDDQGSPRLVSLKSDAVMRREWTLVCDSPGLPVALAAWELPGQQDKDDATRYFEAIWTFNPVAVRQAACTCTMLAGASGIHSVAPVLRLLQEPPDRVEYDVSAVAALFNRMIAYIDTPPPR